MFKCNRCRTSFPRWVDSKCPECGVHKDRIVRKARRSRPIGGKRGRNSGTTNSAKNKA